MRGTDTRATVLDGSVRARELSEVVACHLRLDLDRVEYLAVVDTDDAANHFGNDDHVTEVCLDDCGLFIRGSFFLSFAQFLDQAHGAALEAATKPTAGTCVNEFNELFIVHVKELVEVNSAVGERAEGSLLLELSSDRGVSNR